MFTGIVEEIGTVEAVEHPTGPDGDVVLRVRGPLVTSDAALGDSIAVSGVCLTVTALDGETFSADVMPESLRRTSLGAAAPGTAVNLERALLPTTRMGGHIVQGHVDGVATLRHREPGPRWDTLLFDLPAGLARYVALKGSVTVDGVSLTVSALDDDGFGVSLVPTTLARTTLGARAVGETVNIEVDVLAKHVERLLGAQG